LFKKQNLNPDDRADYRPISSLSTVGKILERLALARLRAHIAYTDQPIANFSPFQSAYHPFHSTETAAMRVVNDLLCTADSVSAFLLVSLDLTAAFDRVNHAKLEEKLTNDFGEKGVALSWIISYMHDRR